MKFIEKPNLPNSRVVAVAINANAVHAINKLHSLGIETINVFNNNNLPKPVAAHADLQMLHIGNNVMFSRNEHLFQGRHLKKFKFNHIGAQLGNKYPDDVLLNCAVIGDKIICNTKTIAPEILKVAESEGFTIINVNQGYAKCSVCVVSKNAIITDDESIFTAAGKFFNDTLFISKGSIVLDGYNYGFIGGCCGKTDKDKIAFNGAIESHKDYKKILDFLSRNSIECIELHNERLNDIGGILPLLEE